MAKEPIVKSSKTVSVYEREYKKVYCDNCKKYSRAKTVKKVNTKTEILENKVNWFIFILLFIITFCIGAIIYLIYVKQKPTWRTASETEIVYCCGFCELPDYITEISPFNNGK